MPFKSKSSAPKQLCRHGLSHTDCPTCDADTRQSTMPQCEAVTVSLPASRLLLSVREGCQLLGCSRAFFYKLRKAGVIKTVRLGRLTKIRQDDLKQVVDSLDPDNDNQAAQIIATSPDLVSHTARGKRKLLVARCHACGRDLLKKEG